MGRKSSIKDLPPEILDAVNGQIRGGRTIDEIVETIHAMGGEASRSAVGRYRKKFEDVAANMRQAQEVARVWVDKLGNEPEGELGRLVIEMIRTVAFNVVVDASEEGSQAGPMDVMLLAKAMQHLTASERGMAELTLKLREQAVKEAAAAADEAATEAGLSDEAAELIRRRILGVRDVRPGAS